MTGGLKLDQLRALRAIVEAGSFEAAADELGVSPSAVSQRIRALEREAGQPVLRRGTPCEPTPAGVGLVRIARHMQVLEDQAWSSLGREAAGRTTTSVAVPADALGTWFAPVLRAAAGWEDTVLDLHVEDQDHSAALVRRGEVLAAVTTEPRPVQGCAVEPLGSMRYLPLVAPDLLERHAGLPHGGHGAPVAAAPDLSAMPMMRFTAKDDLQHAALVAAGLPGGAPTHHAPSFDAFHRCLRAGLGWGMLVDAQADEDLRRGRLVRVPGLEDVLVPLHWQAATLPVPRLLRLTEAVRRAAGAALERG